MSKPIFHTAVYRGKEYTTHTRGFIELLGRSAKFVYTHLKEAEALNKENPMAYVIAVSEYAREEKKAQIKKRSPSRISNIDSNRQKKVERFLTGKEKLINGFIYPDTATIMEKREWIPYI